MDSFYLDSSSLVKRFAREKGTRWLFDIFRRKPAVRLFVARVTHVEVSSALARRAKSGSLGTNAENRYSQRLSRLFKFRFLKVELGEALTLEAVQLARKYALRGYDAVQLAAAIEVQKELSRAGFPPLTFLSADNDLNAAAVAEGLIVENPNDH